MYLQPHNFKLFLDVDQIEFQEGLISVIMSNYNTPII